MNNDLISRSALLDALVEGGVLPAMVRRTIERAPSIEADPCTFCKFDPPSCLDGKPCCFCPAAEKEELSHE